MNFESRLSHWKSYFSKSGGAQLSVASWLCLLGCASLYVRWASAVGGAGGATPQRGLAHTLECHMARGLDQAISRTRDKSSHGGVGPPHLPTSCQVGGFWKACPGHGKLPGQTPPCHLDVGGCLREAHATHSFPTFCARPRLPVPGNLPPAQAAGCMLVLSGASQRTWGTTLCREAAGLPRQEALSDESSKRGRHGVVIGLHSSGPASRAGGENRWYLLG